jgi:hypothetical protein
MPCKNQTMSDLKKKWPGKSIYRDANGYGAIVGDNFIVMPTLDQLDALLILEFYPDDWKERMKELCD